MSRREGELGEGERVMRTFVLGAGASLHVGYPLVKELGPKLVDFISQNPGLRNYPFWPDLGELKSYGPIDDGERSSPCSMSPGLENDDPILRGHGNALHRFEK